MITVYDFLLYGSEKYGICRPVCLKDVIVPGGIPISDGVSFPCLSFPVTFPTFVSKKCAESLAVTIICILFLSLRRRASRYKFSSKTQRVSGRKFSPFPLQYHPETVYTTYTSVAARDGKICHARRRDAKYDPRTRVSPLRFISDSQNKKTDTMNKLKQITLALLLAVTVLPLSAQEKADSAYVFRFVAEKDMFFSPYNGNGRELGRLLEAIEKNRTAIENGQMYLCVTSYCTDGNASQSAEEMAKIRRNRVKSELITRAGVKESHFVTDKSFAEPYKDKEGGLRNVVVVILPAPVEKVAELAGEEAAARVEIYNHEVLGSEAPIVYAKDYAERLEKEQRRIAAERAEAERVAREQAEQKRLAEEKVAQERITQEKEMPAAGEAKAQTAPYHFALRANLLRWATLTPDLGLEWRINSSWGVLVNGSWTSWSRDDKNRRYALWKVTPEVRYYLGKEKRGYLGAMYKVGSFNYKLSDTGKQGDIMGGGISGGYVLRLNNALSMDFSLGLGYIHADYDKYTVIDGVRVRQGNETKNWWGPVSAGISLVWNIF